MTTQAATAHVHEPAHHEEGLSRGMAGMVLFIGSEVMLFGGLFAGYFFVRNQAAAWPPAGVHHVFSDLSIALTVILISSGLIAHMGTLGIKAGNRQARVLATGVAVILGVIFIAGQAYEWFHLFDEDVTAKTGAYGATFFVMTGFHGAHVIAGLAMLGVIFVRALSGDFTRTRHVMVDAGILYWHFVDVVWVFLWVVLYLSY